jgi:hypothetical protein
MEVLDDCIYIVPEIGVTLNCRSVDLLCPEREFWNFSIARAANRQ